jgi:hypothetical protein
VHVGLSVQSLQILAGRHFDVAMLMGEDVR